MADEHTPPGPGGDRPQPDGAESRAGDAGQGTTGQQPPAAPPPLAWGQPPPTGGRPAVRRGWTGPRIAVLVTGSLLALVSLGLLALGGAATWLETHRDGGYVSAGSRTLTTPGYALATDRIYLGSGSGTLLGTLRMRATGQASTTRVFVGIATADQASRYLAGVRYTTVNNVFSYTSGRDVLHDGGTPRTPPAIAGIWTVQTSGIGTQTLVWPVKGGHWSVVAMNADGSPSVTVHASVGATFPPLPWVALGLVVGGALLLAGSAVLIIVPVRRATRRQ